MDETIRTAAISPLRQRMIDDRNVRGFSRETQRNYVRDVGRFATLPGRSPDTATVDDVRQFEIEQREAGAPTPPMNSIVPALRFFFTQTIDRAGLARKLVLGGASPQSARGAEPRRGGAAAQRDHHGQVSSRPLGGLRRRPARGGGRSPQGIAHAPCGTASRRRRSS
jgi:hypothetical protein